MRVASVSEIKTSRDLSMADLPRKGTRARLVYDALRSNAGRPVSLSDAIHTSGGPTAQAVQYLRDFYGCDIRHAGSAHSGRYILAGEWIGSHYADFVNMAIDEAVAAGEAAQ